MNPQKEFVKAIMSVLRLEQNIYTIAAIEEIIDRIDIEDYTMFIAYIGERNSDYEKPIQTIAKAVDEFYKKKSLPLIEATIDSIKTAESMISSIFKNSVVSRAGKTYNEFVYDDRFKNTEMLCSDGVISPSEEWRKIEEDVLSELLNKDENWYRNKELTKTSTGEKVFIDVDLLNEFGIEISHILNQTINHKYIDIRDAVESKLLKKNITEKIESNANDIASKTLGIESKRVLSIIKKASNRNEFIQW